MSHCLPLISSSLSPFVWRSGVRGTSQAPWRMMWTPVLEGSTTPLQTPRLAAPATGRKTWKEVSIPSGHPHNLLDIVLLCPRTVLIAHQLVLAYSVMLRTLAILQLFSNYKRWLSSGVPLKCSSLGLSRNINSYFSQWGNSWNIRPYFHFNYLESHWHSAKEKMINISCYKQKVRSFKFPKLSLKS